MPTLTQDTLDLLDQPDPFSLANTTPDPVAAAALSDPVVRDHVAQTTVAGIEAARAALSQLRLEAIPAAEAAAAPFGKLLAENDEHFKSGALHARFSNDGAMAQKFHETERAALVRDRAAAVKDAVTALRERLDGIETTIVGEATKADAPVALTEAQSRGMTDLLALLPHLSAAERIALLEGAVTAATTDATRRPILRHVLPLLRSLAERPEFARATNAGVSLYVLTQRAMALTRDYRHYAAAAIGRYVGAFSYELGLIESAVVEHGTWGASRPAGFVADGGRGILRVAIASPMKDEPSRWSKQQAVA